MSVSNVASTDGQSFLDQYAIKNEPKSKDLGKNEFLELLVPSTIEGLTIKKSKDQVDGQPVIKLEDRSSEQGTIYVRAEEPHYVVKVSNTGKEAADVVFSAFDEPTEIVAPKPRQEIDFENME